jgi:hypothetical protein
MKRRALYVTGGLIALAVLFQLFFRYQYIHTMGVRITRIDRLTGASCELPCEPETWAPVPTQSSSGAIRWGTVAQPTPTSAVDDFIHKHLNSPAPKRP